MTHLHGGFVAADSDGNPVTDAGAGYAPGQTQHVYYGNQLPQMPASLRWFHDHGMGATRLNVFAGLAAGYLIRDAYDACPASGPACPARARPGTSRSTRSLRAPPAGT
jgi:spore coat protein A